MLFIAIAFPLIAVSFLKLENSRANAARERDVEDAVYRAAYTGAGKLSSEHDGESERKEALEAFFLSLYASFDAIGDPAGKEAIVRSVPLVLLVSDEEFYANMLVCERGPDGEVSFGREWSCATDYLLTHDEDEDPLSGWMNECVARVRSDAERAGIRLRFNMPFYDGSEILRCMDGEVFAALFLKTLEDGFGERDVVFATADYQSRPRRLFAVTEDEAGRRTYHRQGCPYAVDGIIANCYTKKECAVHRAYPCKACFGN